MAKICKKGIAWARRTFDKYPSAYANMAASKYCKDPNLSLIHISEPTRPY